jgi:O-antigen ligase
MNAKIINHQSVGIFSLLLIMAGMLVSEALMSIGMMLLTGNAVFNSNNQQIFNSFIQSKVLVLLTGIFLIYLVSGLWSDNYNDWVDRVRMKLPFLFLPFAIGSIPRFSKRQYQALLYVFMLWVVLACVGSLFLYFIDFESFNQYYQEGRVMPTPVQHVRFSLMVAFSTAIGFFLWESDYVWKFHWEKRVILVLTAFLVVYLHVLAVRSGLLALYAMGFYYALYVAIQRRQFSLLIGVAFGVLVAGGMAYRFLPSFQNRINYSLYTLRMFAQQDKIRDLSDARRLGSMHGGWVLLKTAPWWGVGAGDIKDKMEQYLLEYYPELSGLDLMPHNQFLLIGAGMGVLGLLYFLMAMGSCLWYREAWRDPFFTAFFVLIITSFMVEHTLETQLGTAFFMVFTLMGLRYLDGAGLAKTQN